jgi:hypothetical protein
MITGGGTTTYYGPVSFQVTNLAGRPSVRCPRAHEQRHDLGIVRLGG